MRYLCLALLLLLAGCNRQTTSTSQSGATSSSANDGNDRVVLYCSVDDVYAKPIIALLQKKTGLRIDVLYDTEAAKTAGLANKIRAEGERPQGDVFWSSALLQTILLEEENRLEPYTSPSAAKIPAPFKGKCWASPGVRSRVIVWHKGLANPPRTYADLAQPRFKRLVGISNPQFGTASDELAALGSRWGDDPATTWYIRLKLNRVKVLPGNSVVAQKVASGELLAGITDTDDYLAEKRKGGAIVAGNMQMLAMPGSVAILKNARHPEAAKRLVDALLAPETEAAFCKVMPGVFPTRKQAGQIPPVFDTKRSPVDTTKWARTWRALRDPVPDALTAAGAPVKR